MLGISIKILFGRILSAFLALIFALSAGSQSRVDSYAVSNQTRTAAQACTGRRRLHSRHLFRCPAVSLSIEFKVFLMACAETLRNFLTFTSDCYK